MAASFTGWGKVKSEWVQTGVNSTELAWLLSLKRACKTKPEAFIIILIHCPPQDSKTYIFFRPTPPRLSPGRYTSFYLPEIELICMQGHQ